MRSLSQNYTEAHSNTHETFADLVFCALVVLVLFVLALTVEVSQRVRGAVPEVAQIDEIKAEDVVKLTPEEMEQLSVKLSAQGEELTKLRKRLLDNQAQLQDQLAAMAGEQRFTGAREPAAFSVAYDYHAKRYYFVPSKEVADADRRRSGESVFAHGRRKTEKLVEVALAARDQRGYSLAEINKILGAVTKYQSIEPTASSYRVTETEVGIYYHITLSEYISGDSDGSEVTSGLVERAIARLQVGGNPNSDMYPRCLARVDVSGRSIAVGGVVFKARDLRDILLSVSGRGLLLDFEGYKGKVPSWLYERALVPAGYVGKTPKSP